MRVVVGTQENDISVTELQVNSQETFKLRDTGSPLMPYSHSPAGRLSGTGPG